MTPPRFSVLVPSYNPGRYLPAALDSALEQLEETDELIVQDGGSTDGTVAVLQAVSQRDPRLRWESRPDGGQSDALNLALARAEGDWIVWLNADDILLDGALDAVRAAIAARPDLEIVCGASKILHADGEPVDVFAGRALRTPILLRTGCASFSGSVVVRTELLRSVRGFRTDLDCTMDMALQLELATRGPRQVVIDHPVGALRFHEASKSARLWRVFAREAWALRSRYATTVAERSNALVGTTILMVSMPVFRLRLTPGYRAVRRKLVRS